MTSAWSTEIFAHPACASVAAWAARLPRDSWPSVAALDELYRDRLRPLRLVEDRVKRRARGPRPLEDVYEVRIAEREELPTRAGSWHDLMNVLVWCAFPRSKRALTRRQHAIALARPRTRTGEAQSRTREQDALALFDEGGIVVVSADDTIADNDAAALRAAVAQEDAHLWLFGHALLEAVARGELGVADRRGAGVRIVDSARSSRPDEIDQQLAVALADPTRFDRPERTSTIWLGATLGVRAG